MGRALIGGLLRSGTRPEHLSVGEPVAAAREALARDLGITAGADNAAAVRGAAVVVLAVKPQEAAAVLGALAGQWGAQGPLLISVAAGLRVATLQAWCGPGVAVVRAMPNRPALDVVTALSGSGPAYFFLLAQLMAEAAAGLGLEAAAARRLAAATLHGAGLLAHGGDADLARLRAEVTSRGGTTEAALRVFEDAGLRATVARALEAAALRGRELAAEQPDLIPTAGDS